MEARFQAGIDGTLKRGKMKRFALFPGWRGIGSGTLPNATETFDTSVRANNAFAVGLDNLLKIQESFFCDTIKFKERRANENESLDHRCNHSHWKYGMGECS